MVVFTNSHEKQRDLPPTGSLHKCPQHPARVSSGSQELGTPSMQGPSMSGRDPNYLSPRCCTGRVYTGRMLETGARGRHCPSPWLSPTTWPSTCHHVLFLSMLIFCLLTLIDESFQRVHGKHVLQEKKKVCLDFRLFFASKETYL